MLIVLYNNSLRTRVRDTKHLQHSGFYQQLPDYNTPKDPRAATFIQQSESFDFQSFPSSFFSIVFIFSHFSTERLKY